MCSALKSVFQGTCGHMRPRLRAFPIPIPIPDLPAIIHNAFLNIFLGLHACASSTSRKTGPRRHCIVCTSAKGDPSFFLPIVVGVASYAITSVLCGGFQTVQKLEKIEVSLIDFKEQFRQQGTAIEALNAKLDRGFESLVEERK